MSFEELIKKYESSMAVPMYPKALVIDFMKEAYEAGMKANVHTDNSAVIAELKNKIADIKANCDLAIEGRDVKVMELEKENERLTVSYETLKLHDEEEIGMLKSENAELKKKCYKKAVKDYCKLEKENAELKKKNKWYSEQVCNKECAEVWGNLDKAKEIMNIATEEIEIPEGVRAIRRQRKK